MKTLKILSLTLVIFLGIVSGYYLIIILDARANTTDIVANALKVGENRLELKNLSENQLDMLLKVQDPNFYHHKGVDMTTPGTGVTTLSQGLVKMFYFDEFNPGIKKIKQTLIARFAFDPLTPKDTILQLFINHAYMGQRDGKPLHGFGPAAEYYFGKSFNSLSEDEYLALIAMIRAPSRFNYHSQRAENDLRVSRIKNYLAGNYIPKTNSDWLYDRE
ncbi:MAG TPA: transglycosylase domain-containing protein [Lunatimonas sp.]|nr:transglycosylase domain-containing protein [Lunatimonas sp.]